MNRVEQQREDDPVNHCGWIAIGVVDTTLGPLPAELVDETVTAATVMVRTVGGPE